MQAEAVQRIKAHRFFQSIHSIPASGQTINLQRFNSKVIQESSNLYSLFDLIVIAKSNQLSSDRPLVFYRRLMALIYCINEQYQLYFSKIKALTSFWYEASKNSKNYIQDLRADQENTKQDIQYYKYVMKKEQFLLYTLRCFNSLLQKHIQEPSGSPLQIDMTAGEMLLIKSLFDKISFSYGQYVRSYKYESQHKILLTFQYSKFLLLSFSLHNNVQVEKLFKQFVISLISILRLLKKFYMLSFLEYRNQLNQLIIKAVKIFSSRIPQHKLNLLSSVINYMNRKDPKFRMIPLEYPCSEAKIKITKMLIKIIRSWRDYQQAQIQVNLSSLKIELDHIKLPNDEIQRLVRKSVQKSMNNRQRNKSTYRKIMNLKQRRSQSLRINKQTKQNYLEQSFVEVKRNLSNTIKGIKQYRSRINSAGSCIKSIIIKQEPFLKKSIVEGVRQKLEQKKNKEIKPLRIMLRKK